MQITRKFGRNLKLRQNFSRIYQLPASYRDDFITRVDSKAGRFVGIANCYAPIVLADNTTSLLAVNRRVAHRTQAPNRSYYSIIISDCRGSTGRASASGSLVRGFDSHLATPILHSLSCEWFEIVKLKWQESLILNLELVGQVTQIATSGYERKISLF